MNGEKLSKKHYEKTTPPPEGGREGVDSFIMDESTINKELWHTQFVMMQEDFKRIYCNGKDR